MLFFQHQEFMPNLFQSVGLGSAMLQQAHIVPQHRWHANSPLTSFPGSDCLTRLSFLRYTKNVHSIHSGSDKWTHLFPFLPCLFRFLFTLIRSLDVVLYFCLLSLIGNFVWTTSLAQGSKNLSTPTWGVTFPIHTLHLHIPLASILSLLSSWTLFYFLLNLHRLFFFSSH